MVIAKVWKAELLKISLAWLNSLRKQVRCCQVMDVSPSNSLSPGEYVLLGKCSRAMNLDFRFDSAISTPERAIRMKRISENLVTEERELTVFGKSLASTNSTVSQLSPESRLKKRRVEAVDSIMERRFEALKRRMQAMEADNVDLRDRLKRVEAKMKLYVSSGINLIIAACNLVEYVADLISFEQRNIIATQVLKLIPSTDVQPDSVKKINVGFRSFWGSVRYIENVRFNRWRLLGGG